MSKGTPHRCFRIPDEVWFPAKAKAESEGASLSDIIREALRAYIDNDAGYALLAKDADYVAHREARRAGPTRRRTE